MSPAALSLSTNRCTKASCSGSVVRMKKSLLALSWRASSLKRGASWSTCCRGVRPRSAAACATLLPCSSTPVRKKTSSPFWRWYRARMSAAMVV